MAYSEAQKRATLKYKEKAYDQINIQVKKGTKDIWKEAAKKKGLPLSTYIAQLIEKDMENKV